jgi:hypothetical protein
MKNTLKSVFFLFMSISLLGLIACEDEEKETELTTAEKIVGTWLADASTGDLGNATASSGSLAGAGWTSYQLTLNDDIHSAPPVVMHMIWCPTVMVMVQ